MLDDALAVDCAADERPSGSAALSVVGDGLAAVDVVAGVVPRGTLAEALKAAPRLAAALAAAADAATTDGGVS